MLSAATYFDSHNDLSEYYPSPRKPNQGKGDLSRVTQGGRGADQFLIPHPPSAAYGAGGASPPLSGMKGKEPGESERKRSLCSVLGPLAVLQLLVPIFALLCPRGWSHIAATELAGSTRPCPGTREPVSCHWESLTLLPGPCPDLLSGSLPSPGAATWPSRSWRLRRRK